ncbi:putative membrane protein [Dysgonomonadaceae bacterium PH5-43]|nr:putative membrane protein [Dysgonomonadaceae bacterium PH5-43]
MNKLKQHSKIKDSLIYLTLITVFLYSLITVYWSHIFIDKSLLYWSLGVITFFFLYETFSIVFVNKQAKIAKPKQMVAVYMMLKGLKLFVFLGTLVIYMLAIKIEAKRFVLVSVAIYFIYLLLDTLFLSWVEKGIKTEKTEDK